MDTVHLTPHDNCVPKKEVRHPCKFDFHVLMFKGGVVHRVCFAI